MMRYCRLFSIFVCGFLLESALATPLRTSEITRNRHSSPQDTVMRRVLSNSKKYPENPDDENESVVKLSPFNLVFNFTLPDVVSTGNGQQILSTEEEEVIRMYIERFLAKWYQSELDQEKDDIKVKVSIKRLDPQDVQEILVSQGKGPRTVRRVSVRVHFRNIPNNQLTVPMKDILNDLTAMAFLSPQRESLLVSLHNVGQALEEENEVHQVLTSITDVMITKAILKEKSQESKEDVSAARINEDKRNSVGVNSSRPVIFGVTVGSFLVTVGALVVALCILSKRPQKCCGHTLCSDSTVNTSDNPHYIEKVFENYDPATPPRRDESSEDVEKESEVASDIVVVERGLDEITASSSSLSAENRLSPTSQPTIDIDEETTTITPTMSNSFTPSSSFNPVILTSPQTGFSFSSSISAIIKRGSATVYDTDDTSTLDQSYSSLDLPSLLGEVEGLSTGRQSYLLDEEKSFLFDDSSANCEDTVDGMDTVNVVVSPEERLEMEASENDKDVSSSASEEEEIMLNMTLGTDVAACPSPSYETEDESSQLTRSFEQVWHSKDTSKRKDNFSGEASV